MKKRIINYVLILIFLVLAITFTFIAIKGYQDLTSAIEFRVECLIELILGISGVVASLIVLTIFGIKVIDKK